MKLIMMIPALVLFGLFTAWPIAEVVRLSFYKTNFILSSFVGLGNYIAAFQDQAFVKSMLNSLIYMMLMVIGQTVSSLFIALALYPMSKKWQDNSRIVLYVPMLSAGIIIAQSWKWIFHTDGPMNWLAGLLGMAKVDWFGEYMAIPVVVFVVVFSSFGGNVILLLSSLQSMNREYIEAAKVDGASWRQIKYLIIIPILLPTIGMIMLLSAIASFQVFETIYALAPYEYSATMTFHIYRQGFQFGKYGLASAQAIILLVITVILSLAKRRLER